MINHIESVEVVISRSHGKEIGHFIFNVSDVQRFNLHGIKKCMKLVDGKIKVYRVADYLEISVKMPKMIPVFGKGKEIDFLDEIKVEEIRCMDKKGNTIYVLDYKTYGQGNTSFVISESVGIVIMCQS